MNKRPLVRAGAVLLAGETACLAGRKNIIYAAVIAAAVILTVLVSSRICSLGKCNILLLFCCFLGGVGMGGIALYERQGIDMVLGDRVTVTGLIRECKDKGDSYEMLIESGKIKVRAYVAKTDIKQDSDTDINRDTDIDMPVLGGRKITVEGVLEMPEESRNPGSFDMYSYYTGENIAGLIYTEKAEIGEKKNRVIYILEYLRQSMKEELYRFFPDEHAAFLTGLILGEKSGIDKEMKLLYMKNGLAHILAISGLHIAIVAGALEKILEMLGVGRKKRGTAVIILILLYGIMTGFASSTVRVFVCLLMRHLALLSGRSNDVPTDMMTAILIISIINPRAVFTAGTQLSFLAALGMYISNEIFICFFGWKKIYLKKEGKEKEVLYSERYERIRNSKWLNRIMDRDKRKELRNKAVRTLISTVVINLLLMPVLIYYYFEIYPYGMLLGLIVLPTVAFVIAGGFSVALLGLFVKCVATLLPNLTTGITAAARFAAVVIAAVADKMLSVYEGLCRIGLKLPYSSVNPGHAAPVTVCFCMVLLMSLMWWLLFSGRKKRRTDILTVGSIALISTAAFLIITGYLNYRKVRVVYLDVGQGLSTVIHFPGKGNYLVDGGSTSRQNVGENVIIPALKYYGMSDIRAAFISHTDTDHISGIIELAELSELYRIEIESVFMAYPDEEGENYKLLLKALGDIPVIKGLSAGDEVDGCFIVIYPTAEYAGQAEDENERCLVVKGGGVLFPGDISAETERRIAEGAEAGIFPDISADTLVVSHHGSRFSSDERFLRKVSAGTAIISCGRNNIYGHPAEETLWKLEERGMKIYRTDQSGAVIFEE